MKLRQSRGQPGALGAVSQASFVSATSKLQSRQTLGSEGIDAIHASGGSLRRHPLPTGMLSVGSPASLRRHALPTCSRQQTHHEGDVEGGHQVFSDHHGRACKGVGHLVERGEWHLDAVQQ